MNRQDREETRTGRRRKVERKEVPSAVTLHGPGSDIRDLLRYSEGRPARSQLAGFFPETPNNHCFQPADAEDGLLLPRGRVGGKT